LNVSVCKEEELESKVEKEFITSKHVRIESKPYLSFN
jgi:hypothetical protein